MNQLNPDREQYEEPCPLCKHELEPGVDDKGNSALVCTNCCVGWLPAEDYASLLNDEVTQEVLLP